MAVVLDLNIVAGSVWQDSAGTIPAAVGDPVGRVDDPDRGIFVAQSTTSRKPVLLQDANGHLYLAFDGSDDNLYTSEFGHEQPMTTVLAARHVSTGDNKYLLGGDSFNVRFRWVISNYEMHAGASVNGGANTGALRVFQQVWNGPSSVLRVDAAETSGDAGTRAFVELSLGGYGATGVSTAQIEVYRLRIFDTALTAQERADEYTLLNDLYSNPAGGGDPEPINLSASAQGQALADAQVLRQVLMQAEAQGSGAATAALQALRHLEAVAVGAGDAEAQILIERYAEATGDAAGAAQAALSIARQLSASAAGLSEAQAAAIRQMMLEASAAGAGTAQATLSTDTSILLAGTAAAVGGAQVEPEIRRLLEARAGGEGGQAAALFLQRLLSANAIASGSASASLTVGIVLRPGKMTVSVRPYYEIEAAIEPFYTIEATIREAVTS